MSSRVRRIGAVLSKVNFTGDCWLWLGEIKDDGYGKHGGQVAHRVVYELLVGPIPDGLELDHLCRVTACVFPDHLEPVTRLENIRRRRASNDHCRNGHLYTPQTTYVRAGTTTRICRICQRAASARYAQKVAQ